jgi:hypothetical protein
MKTRSSPLPASTSTRFTFEASTSTVTGRFPSSELANVRYLIHFPSRMTEMSSANSLPFTSSVPVLVVAPDV